MIICNFEQGKIELNNKLKNSVLCIFNFADKTYNFNFRTNHQKIFKFPFSDNNLFYQF